MIEISATFQDFIDVGVLVGIVGEKKTLPKYFKDMYDLLACEIACWIYVENGLSSDDVEKFMSLPRQTILGPRSAYFFDQLCDWLIRQDAEFAKSIREVYYFEAVCS